MANQFKKVEYTGHWNSEDFDPVELKEELYKTLRHTRINNGVSYASIGEHYIFKCWVRDMVNCALPELEENPTYYKETFHAILDFYIDCEKTYNKFTNIIENPHNKQDWEFPHPRLDKNKQEIHKPWGFIQFDAIGLFLFGVYLGEATGIQIIRDDEDRKIIDLIIQMLEKIQVYQVEDHGCWEESKKLETSSLGAILGGLAAIRLVGFKVNQSLLDKTHERLNDILPRESYNRDVDLAQLSLIFPLNILDAPRARQIIANVEAKLLRDNGVLRYENDQYYNPTGKPEDSPAWCFGLSYLALAWNTLGEFDKAKRYAKMIIDRTILKGVVMPLIDKETGVIVEGEYVISNAAVPEMFVNREPNDNTPLIWSNSFAILALKSTGFIK